MTTVSVKEVMRRAKSHALKGEVAEARAHYEAVLQAFPDHKGARAALRELAKIRKNPISLDPPESSISQLVSLCESGRLDAAANAASRLVQEYPSSAVIWNILGIATAGLGRVNEAERAFREAANANPDFPEAHFNLGRLLQGRGKLDPAVDCFRRALTLRRRYPEAHNGLGIALLGHRKLDEAIENFRNAVKLQPDYLEAHNNLGLALQETGDLDAAIMSFRQALKLEPNYPEAHNNLGIALREKGMLEPALTSFRRALKLRPDYPDAHNNLAIALKDQGKVEAAIESFRKALALQPAAAAVQAQCLYQQARINDWSANDTFEAVNYSLGIEGEAVPPFSLLSLEDSPERSLLRSKAWAAQKYRRQPMPFPARSKQRRQPIRVGYFSADFHDHPVMRLAVRLFETHDREKFQIQAFSYGPDADSPFRERLVKSFDAFHDIRTLTEKGAAQLAREQEIDIAIDLSGYTIRSRTGILAYRAAPVQISYLGYPGTMGAPFIDYVVADQVLIPAEERKYYSERIIHMPNCYQPRDDSKVIEAKTLKRSDFGLRDDGFIFCSFNDPYKISRNDFDIWTRLLREIEGSYLWIYTSNTYSERNLLAEVKSRGVAAERLIFAQRFNYSDYLARFRVADLFLDTTNYGAGATAGDALWAGLPVLTNAGRSYTARMATSLLTALDVPELITTSEAEFENRALELAQDREALGAIKAKIARNIKTTPLFDSERYTSDFERGLETAHELHLGGDEPQDIYL